MQKQIKVSIIIPVHNVEEYLHESIGCIINQTLKEIEIILIDDGSTDQSLSIIKEYARKDGRIRVLQNGGNLGAGESRNRGLEIANGEYLLFLDSDDIFEPELVESIYNVCKKNNLDICIYNYDKFDDKSKNVYDRFEISAEHQKMIGNIPFSVRDIGAEVLTIWTCALWNRMLKRTYVTEQGFRFQNLHNANDLFFSYTTLALAKRVMYVETKETLLHYRTGMNGQLSSNRSKVPDCIYRALEAMVKFYKKECPDLMKDGFYVCIMNHLINSIKSLDVEHGIEMITKYKEEGLERLGILRAVNLGMISERYRRVVDNIMLLSGDEAIKRFLVNETTMFSNTEKKKTLFDYIEKHNYHVALWGAGNLGGRFLESCMDEERKVECVIDSDVEKQGVDFYGYIVSDFKNCIERINAVLVTNVNLVESIMNDVRKVPRKMILLDLYSYFGYDKALDNCIHFCGEEMSRINVL